MGKQRISESEWQVMNVVWAKAPVAAGEVVAALEEAKGWHSRTTRTLLARLVKKKALRIRPGDKCAVYEPLMSQEEGRRQESQSLVQRVFGGEPAAMLLHVVEESNLSRSKIRKLKEILAEKEK